MSTDANINDFQKVLNLPPIDQIGFVVDDIDHAMTAYSSLFGPWQCMNTEVKDADFRGERHDCSLKMAFGKSGDIEIELIQVTDGMSPHTEFLAAGRSGMHHIRYPVDNLKVAIDRPQTIGYRPIWQKRINAAMAFAYLERNGGPLIIELLEHQLP